MGNEAAFFDAEASATETEATEVGAAFEVEPYEGQSIVEVGEVVDLASELEAPAIVETPLADADEAALEAGIASVFDTILAEGFDEPLSDVADNAASEVEGEEIAEDDALYALAAYDDDAVYDDDAYVADEYEDDEATIDDEEPTFALLAELNRIWAQPLAA